MIDRAGRAASAGSLFIATLLIAGCGTTTPLAREVQIGTDAYAIFVGDGRGAGSDLYAVPGRGGQAIQLTYSPVEEVAPALSPDGGAVAFVRRASSGARTVWVLNLISGAERKIELPDSAALPVRVGWSLDGAGLYVETEGGAAWRAVAPPRPADAQPVPRSDPNADSALSVLVGSPRFARIEACISDGVPALCAVSDDGTAPLATGAASAARWGGDSVAYFVEEELLVRPLRGGRVRAVKVDAAPEHPRELTAFGGAQ